MGPRVVDCRQRRHGLVSLASPFHHFMVPPPPHEGVGGVVGRKPAPPRSRSQSLVTGHKPRVTGISPQLLSIPYLLSSIIYFLPSTHKKIPQSFLWRIFSYVSVCYTSLLKSPQASKKERVLRSWEIRLSFTASSFTITITLSR